VTRGDPEITRTDVSASKVNKGVEVLRPILNRDWTKDVWRKIGIPRNRDVSCLMGPNSSGRPHFETRAEVKERKRKLIEVLENFDPALAAAYSNCSRLSPCSIPGCPSCGRWRRAYLYSETARIYELVNAEPCLFVTVYIADIPSGRLRHVRLRKVKKNFQKRLERKGIRGVLVGGIEPQWDARKKVWILHFHILSIGVTEGQWDRVVEGTSKGERAYTIKKERIDDPVRVISYLQKWVTYFRPFRQNGSKRSPAVPLKPQQIVELCRWWAAHHFDDFLFLCGARRRNGRIYPENTVEGVGSVGKPQLIFSRSITLESSFRGKPLRITWRDEVLLPDRAIAPRETLQLSPDTVRTISTLPDLPQLLASLRETDDPASTDFIRSARVVTGRTVLPKNVE
jgi:hypothetical protein